MVKLSTFKRGIHPPHGKEYTQHKKIEYYMDPKEDLVFPMVQHIGAPCKPIVKKGDPVLVGQVIGEPTAFVCSPIHSSVSGTVKNVKPMLHTNGAMVMSVIIENDHQMEEHESLGPKKSMDEFTNEEILEEIKNAGIVGMGGAGFPTHIKLAPPPDKVIDYVIINGAECEPYLTSDHRVMLEETDRVVTGLKIILKLFPNAKGVIAIENNKPDAIAKMEEAVADESNIQVVPLKTKYPQGAEKQLIYAVTGREVPSGKLPADAGCIVQNIDTAVAIHRAIVRGRPLMRRIVTVTGSVVKEPKNFKVRIGTSFKELIEAAGGFTEEPGKIIAGGPMMGMAQYSLDIPIVKGSGAILCLSKKDIAYNPQSNCIRCGKCVEVCPIHLIPSELNHNSIRQEWDDFEKNRGLDCIECGCCSFECPAKRHIVQSIRTAKRTVIANKKKK